MTASRSRRRNHTIAAALSGVLVLGAAPVLAYVGWQVIQDSKEGTSVTDDVDEVAFPSTPTAMVAVVDDQQVVTSLVLMVLSPRAAGESVARGGKLIVVPTDASTSQGANDAELPVAHALINGGEEGLVAAVESLMRVTIGHHAIMDEATAATLFAPVQQIPVTFPNDVVTELESGDTETLFVSGDAELDPEQAVSVLLARTDDGREAARMPNVNAVWSGFAEAVGTGVNPTGVTSTTPADFNDFFAHLTAGPVEVFTELTTDPVVGSDNPDALDVGRLNVASVVLLMAGLAPSAMIAPMPTLSFRIENGVTQADIDAAGLENVTPVDVTRDLVARLLFRQGNVISVSTEVFTPEDKAVPDTTALYTTGNFESSELELFTEFLGDVDFVDPKFRFPQVDVVIVVGDTYLADMADKQGSASSTSPEPTVAATTEST